MWEKEKRREGKRQGRGGKKDEPRTNIAQGPSELTWENAIVRAGPFNAGGRGRGPCRGKKKKLRRRGTHFGRLSIEGAKTHNHVFPS